MSKEISFFDITEATTGKIISVKNRGLDCPTEIIVEYYVDGIRFSRKESVKLKRKMIKAFGFLPIGLKQVPKLPTIEVGAQVTVVYKPHNPTLAYVDGNQGRINC